MAMVLVLAPRVFFSSGSPVSPYSTKTNTSKLQFDQEAVEARATSWISTKILIYLFVYLLLQQA